MKLPEAATKDSKGKEKESKTQKKERSGKRKEQNAKRIVKKKERIERAAASGVVRNHTPYNPSRRKNYGANSKSSNVNPGQTTQLTKA